MLTDSEAELRPTVRSILAGWDAPVSAFLKLRPPPPAFLLESAEQGGRSGRYSFMGLGWLAILEARGSEVKLRFRDRTETWSPPEVQDPLHLVQQLLRRQVARIPEPPPSFGGAVGYLSYEMACFFERLPEPASDELKLPDCVFAFPEAVLVFDHLRHELRIITYNDEPAGSSSLAEEIAARLAQPLTLSKASRSGRSTAEFVSNFTEEKFCRIVAQAKEYIAAGEVIQVVLSQRLRGKTSASSFDIYRALRHLNPSPYMFYLDFGGFQLIGSSPEMLVRLRGTRAESRPIAGTRPRGKTSEEDEALIAELLSDPKERAEHLMLVDLARNDLGRVCRYGTVRVPEFMTVEKYSHVSHLVSRVEGELRPGEDAFSLLRASFPAGTVSGAPKIRAMEIIAELEDTRRGPYAGAVGYFDFRGDMDTCITIRTIVKIGNMVYLQGGAGIVADSDPVREYRETFDKLQALVQAVRLAEER